jgi:hypothetical protein
MKTTGFLTLDADLLREVRSVAVDEGRSISTFTRCARPTGVWRPAKGTSLRNLLGAGFGLTTVHEHRAERHDVPAGFLTSRARIPSAPFAAQQRASCRYRRSARRVRYDPDGSQMRDRVDCGNRWVWRRRLNAGRVVRCWPGGGTP